MIVAFSHQYFFEKDIFAAIRNSGGRIWVAG
jgi:hypothetical protein